MGETFQNQYEHTSGPNQVIPSNTYTATDPTSAVKIRESSDTDFAVESVSVPEMIERAAKIAPENTSMAVKRQGQWITWKWCEYLQQSKAAAKAFIKLGLEEHGVVAIIGSNSPEWTLSNNGAILAGGISCGLSTAASSSQLKIQLQKCDPYFVIVENDKQLKKVADMKDSLKNLKAIVKYIGIAKEGDAIDWQEFMKTGSEEDDEELRRRQERAAVNHCCSLVFTPGTTGDPKCVMFSHDSITWSAHLFSAVSGLKKGEEAILSYLPLDHISNQMNDIYAMLYVAGTTHFLEGGDAASDVPLELLRVVRPTIFVGGPPVWEAIQARLKSSGKTTKGLQKSIVSWAKETGLKENKVKLRGLPRRSKSFRIAEKLVFKKVRQSLGFDRCRNFFNMSDPISLQVLEYFVSLNIVILESYGLSECCGPNTMNTTKNVKFGTAGKPLPALKTEMRKRETEKGAEEIGVWGRNVMMGYLSDKKATDEAVDSDGWLFTGDLGCSDREGYFSVCGRRADVFITAGGEAVSPEAIERLVKLELPCVSDAVVVGDSRKYLACLLTLRADQTSGSTHPLHPVSLAWCAEVGSKSRNVQEVIKGPDITAMRAIQEGINRVNAKASSNEQTIKKWTILPRGFSEKGGELGPTQKLKRSQFVKKYEKFIERLYTT